MKDAMITTEFVQRVVLKGQGGNSLSVTREGDVVELVAVKAEMNSSVTLARISINTLAEFLKACAPMVTGRTEAVPVVEAKPVEQVKSRKISDQSCRVWSSEELTKAANLKNNGMNYRQIGSVLGRSAKAVQKQHSRGNFPGCPYNPNELRQLSGQIGNVVRQERRATA